MQYVSSASAGIVQSNDGLVEQNGNRTKLNLVSVVNDSPSSPSDSVSINGYFNGVANSLYLASGFEGTLQDYINEGNFSIGINGDGPVPQDWTVPNHLVNVDWSASHSSDLSTSVFSMGDAPEREYLYGPDSSLSVFLEADSQVFSGYDVVLSDVSFVNVDVSFMSGGDPIFYGALRGIEAQAVPEPATGLLIGGAAATALFLRRRFYD